MKRGQLIWGIICVAVAVLLAVLYVTQPAGTVTFMVEGTDMPYVPPIVLGILGIALLSSAGSRTQKGTQEEQPPAVDEAKVALNKRLETIGWGCFLIMLGGFIFVPDATVDKGVWSIGVGVIMLGLNVARYYNKIKMSGFTTVLGILALCAGIAQLAEVDTFGGSVEKRQLLGKAEES
jgi:drug/metabolite transporter (DMT)-like permease